MSHIQSNKAVLLITCNIHKCVEFVLRN